MVVMINGIPDFYELQKGILLTSRVKIEGETDTYRESQKPDKESFEPKKHKKCRLVHKGLIYNKI